jgi:hypothetical protein
MGNLAGSAATAETGHVHDAAAGVALLPLSMYGVDTPPGPVWWVGYGAIPTERLDEGLRRVRRCFPMEGAHDLA